MQMKYLFVLAALLAVAYATSETGSSDLVAEESHEHPVAHSRQKRTILLKKILAKKALALGGAALLGAGIYKAVQNKRGGNYYGNGGGSQVVYPGFGYQQPQTYQYQYPSYSPYYQTYRSYQPVAYQPQQQDVYSNVYPSASYQQLPSVPSATYTPHATYGAPAVSAPSSNSFVTAEATASGYP